MKTITNVTSCVNLDLVFINDYSCAVKHVDVHENEMHLKNPYKDEDGALRYIYFFDMDIVDIVSPDTDEEKIILQLSSVCLSHENY